MFTCGSSSTSYRAASFASRRLIVRSPTRRAAASFVAAGTGSSARTLPASERYAFDAFAHYDINNSMRAYMEYGYHDDHTFSQIAPSGAFVGPIITLHGENPLIAPSMQAVLGLAGPGTTTDVLIGRRNIEGGGRQQDLRHTSNRTVIGLKGDIMKNWDYDVFFQTGKVVYSQTYLNDFSTTRTLRALDVVPGPGGVPTCRSVIDGTDPNCVPYNFWHLGGVNQAALNYVQIPLLASGYTQQSVNGGTLSSDLGTTHQAPQLKNGVGVAFGLERREACLHRRPFASGQLRQGGLTIGSRPVQVKEYFGEIRVRSPRQRLADLLSVNASYRLGLLHQPDTDSYGLGIEWAPARKRSAQLPAGSAPPTCRIPGAGHEPVRQ